MDITTTYLGKKLKSPLCVSASPLSEEISNIRQMEDAGAGAVVLYSLFEEQLIEDRRTIARDLEQGTESFAESLSYFPEPAEWNLGPDFYLEHIRKAKAAVDIPIIASLNGHTDSGWIDHARSIQEAGADALELNIYFVPTDMNQPGTDIEDRYLAIVRRIRGVITIPLAVKIGPFFSNTAFMAKQMDNAGVNALVLFNRFYQPDINIDEREIEPRILFSTPFALRLPLTWIGILYRRIKAELAATSGIHRPMDVIKMIMAGANVTMLCSSLYKHGIDHIKVLEREMREWMEDHEYESVDELRGCMSQISCQEPGVFERALYVRAVQAYHTGA